MRVCELTVTRWVPSLEAGSEGSTAEAHEKGTTSPASASASSQRPSPCRVQSRPNEHLLWDARVTAPCCPATFISAKFETSLSNFSTDYLTYLMTYNTLLLKFIQNLSLLLATKDFDIKHLFADL